MESSQLRTSGAFAFLVASKNADHGRFKEAAFRILEFGKDLAFQALVQLLFVLLRKRDSHNRGSTFDGGQACLAITLVTEAVVTYDRIQFCRPQIANHETHREIEHKPDVVAVEEFIHLSERHRESDNKAVPTRAKTGLDICQATARCGNGWKHIGSMSVSMRRPRNMSVWSCVSQL